LSLPMMSHMRVGIFAVSTMPSTYNRI
jgi:hypothetical protein